jgi:hypothetical protein
MKLNITVRQALRRKAREMELRCDSSTSRLL